MDELKIDVPVLSIAPQLVHLNSQLYAYPLIKSPGALSYPPRGPGKYTFPA